MTAATADLCSSLFFLACPLAAELELSASFASEPLLLAAKVDTEKTSQSRSKLVITSLR